MHDLGHSHCYQGVKRICLGKMGCISQLEVATTCRHCLQLCHADRGQ